MSNNRGDGHSPDLSNRPLTRKHVAFIWLLVGTTIVFSAVSAAIALRWLA